MSTAASLDHVGIAGRDLGAMAAAFERLGFQLTPLARHSGKRTPDGPVVPFGTGNRCIMLREGYIELIAIVDPAAFSNTLDRFLARYAGIHIIALGIEDETANLDRLRQAGIDIPGVAYLERPVDDADPDGP
ncbi:MAG: VOC family protein, partial [Rhodospirillales bacterium]|nr:VOC family protein [Rhodospirillales bacterium]